MADRNWETFLALLRAGLWEQAVRLPGALDETTWNLMLQQARDQAVTGILLRGVAHLEETQLPPAPVRMRLIAETDLLDRKGRLAGSVEQSVLSLFRQEGLHPVVQKGSQSARHYPHPELRVSGDVDLYIQEDEFGRAVTLVDDARRAPDGSYLFKRQGVTV